VCIGQIFHLPTKLDFLKPKEKNQFFAIVLLP